MPGIDIDETHDSYTVTFELRGAQGKNLIVKGCSQTVHVYAVRDIAKLVLDADGDPEFDNNLMYDKSAVLPGKADTGKLEWEFFGGLIEVTVPKAK